MNLPDSIFQNIAQNAKNVDYDGCFPEKEFQQLAEACLLHVTLPGEPLDFAKNCTSGILQLLKTIGRASLPVGRIYEGHLNALYLVNLFGTPEQQNRWYDDAWQKKLFGVWNTQDQQGIFIHDLGSGHYRLEGFKTFCSGGSHVTRPLVTGELISNTQKGWQMCIIPTEKVKTIVEDRSFWKPLGMKPSASYRIDFTGIELTQDDLLGPPDAYYRQPYFSGGAIRFAAVQLGGAEALLEEMHGFIKQMHRTQDPFQQARLAEIAYLIESGNLWLNQAGIKFDQWLQSSDNTERILSYTNMTRTVIEEICLRTLQLAERSVGSRGLMRPGTMERMHRDLTTYLRQPAPDATLTSIGAYIYNQPTTHDLWKS